MPQPGAIRARRAFVELFADDSKLVRGLRRGSARLKAFGESVRNMGLKLAGLAVGYLLICRRFPSLWQLCQQSSNLAPIGMDRLLLIGLAVLAAPPVEEFIFRGLLLRGLERMGRPALAVLGSAAIFAVIHPPISIAPVFVLGLAAGIALRRTGLLLAAITTHATYNALALLGGYLLGAS